MIGNPKFIACAISSDEYTLETPCPACGVPGVFISIQMPVPDRAEGILRRVPAEDFSAPTRITK